MFFDELHGFCDDGFGQFLVLEACRMTALHVADAADAIDNHAGVLLIRTKPGEQVGALKTGGGVSNVLNIADLDRVRRIEPDYFVVFDPNTRHAIHRGWDDMAVIESNLERPGVYIAIKVYPRLAVAEAKVPFTDNPSLVACLAQHGGKSEPAWFNTERRVTIEDRVLLGGLAPGVFAG